MDSILSSDSQHKLRQRSGGPLNEDNRVQRVGGGQNSLKNNFNKKKIKRHLEYIDGKISDYLTELSTLDSKEKKNREDKKRLSSLKKKNRTKRSKAEGI